jgi:CubicO group peptidase (beta-lactamase class C family)
VEPPEQHGLSTALLAKAAETIRTRAQERYCLLVIKDGVIVHETYYANTSSSVYESDSLAKTTTAALLGVAVQDGLLDIDRPLREYGVEPHAIWQQPNGSDYCPGPCEQFKRP